MTSPRSETLTIETSDAPNHVRILKLSGPITLHTLFELQQIGREDATHPVVLEMTDVSYMDSAGLGCVLGMFVSCQRKERGFAISGLSDRVRVLLKMTHVDGILPLFDTLEAAEAAASAR